MQSAAKTNEARFAFGANWQKYLSVVDGARIAEAERSLTSMLGVEDLQGKSFLDVGCGSEWYIAHGFAATLDVSAAGMVDFVHEIAKYYRADFFIDHRSRSLQSLRDEFVAGCGDQAPNGGVSALLDGEWSGDRGWTGRGLGNYDHHHTQQNDDPQIPGEQPALAKYSDDA